MPPRVLSAIPVSARVTRVNYAIRRIVEEAQKVEATGRRVRYLNIGDPVLFGFETPRYLIDAVERAMRDGDNGYAPSAGILEAREAIAAQYNSLGQPMTPDRIVLTAGASEGIDFALTTLADVGDEVLIPRPTYPLYTAILAKLGAREVYYRTDPANGWLPDPDEIRKLITPRTRALVVNDPNNPTGAVYPLGLRRALLSVADEFGLPILADEIYQDLAYTGSIAPLGSLDPDAPILSLSGLSKGYQAPGWRTGWLALGRSPSLDSVLSGILKLAEGRLCTTTPMQHAIPVALSHDAAHQVDFRLALQQRAALISQRANAIPGMSCVMPQAAFYAMPRVTLPPGKTDVDYILGLLRATGVLCVYGSGFGMDPADGFFRLVYLASPAELSEIFDLVEDFTRSFCRA
jgi:alanine-synthesizing transaminase